MESALENAGPFGPAQDIIREEISTLKIRRGGLFASLGVMTWLG